MSTTQTESVTAVQVQAEAQGESVLNFGHGQNVYKLPSFKNKHDERKWAKEQVAGAFRVFAKLGFADGGAGHISLRDPVNPDLFWINPYAKHFGLMTVADLVLVNKEGVSVTPTTRFVNAAGFIIHSSIHEARQDVNVAIHLHSPYGRAWSIFGKPVEMLTQDSCYFYDELSVYEGFGGAAVAREEGDRMAAALGPTNKTIILQNHGLLTCGASVGEAAAYFIALERACQAQLLAEAAAANGIAKKYIGEEEAAYTKGLHNGAFMDMQFLPEYEMVLKESNGDFLVDVNGT